MHIWNIWSDAVRRRLAKAFKAYESFRLGTALAVITYELLCTVTSLFLKPCGVSHWLMLPWLLAKKSGDEYGCISYSCIQRPSYVFTLPVLPMSKTWHQTLMKLGSLRGKQAYLYLKASFIFYIDTPSKFIRRLALFMKMLVICALPLPLCYVYEYCNCHPQS